MPSALDELMRVIWAALGAWRLARMVAQEDGPGAIFLLWRSKLGEWRDRVSAEYARTQSQGAYRRLFNLAWLQDGFNCVWCLSWWLAGALVWAWGLSWRHWPAVAGMAALIEMETR